MDLAHFGLRSRPFRTTPDTDFYYPATSHEVALVDLQQALEDEEGLALLSGETGTGKTLLAHRLLETLLEEHRSITLSHTHFASRSDLLQAMLFDLGLPYQNRSEQELRLGLIESCIDHFASDGRTLVVIDEAHHLSEDHLEEVRLLSNLGAKNGKAMQFLLVALPEFLERIKKTARGFYQRLAVRAVLEPMNEEEAKDYILHQVRIAGGRPERLFHAEACDMIIRFGQGNPRLLNQLCSTSLYLAHSAEAHHVDLEAVLEAVNRLGLNPESSDATEKEELHDGLSVEEGALPKVLVYGSDPEVRSGRVI